MSAVANPQTPSPWVARFVSRITANARVLDLACGSGRHTRLLLARGHRVLAADIDVSGLSDIGRTEDLEVVETDLESPSWPFGDHAFDAIVVTNYLFRPHLPRLAQALRDDGLLIYDTFAEGHEQFGRPRNPDFLLRPGELLEVFSDKLTIVAYEHGRTNDPRPAVRQRLCAVRGQPEPWRLTKK